MCGSVRADDEGSAVVLAGWVSRKRDHGGVVFLDLRDREGSVQVVAHPDDADFGPAATVHRWVQEGSIAHLVCCTSGDAGADDANTDPLKLAQIREAEQRSAGGPPGGGGEHDPRLWRVLHHYVDEARAGTSHAGVVKVGIDETSSKRGQDYVSLFVDLDGPRVTFATPGRDASTVERFAGDLTVHGGDPGAVAEVCTDMSQAFIKGVGEHLPNAEITFDRYHLAQLLSRAVDQVRREEAPLRPELRRTRYLWLKGQPKLSQRQLADLTWLRVRSRGLATARAYRWKLAFEAFYEQPAEEAEGYLERWYRGAVRSRLEPIKAFAYTVDDHWDGVIRWHATRISNGVLEGINSLVQAAKRRARGYRSTRNLIAMIYLIAGKLDLASTHTM